MKKKLFNLILYCPADFLQKVLDIKQSQIEYYAFIKHDKDVYMSDILDEQGAVKHKIGELKIEHIHLVMMLKTWRQVKDVKKWFSYYDDNGDETTVLYRDNKGSVKDCLLYLTHDNAPEKVHYDRDNVVSFNIDWVQMDKYADLDAPVDNTYDIIQDMLIGEPLLSMIKKYGRDFVYHYQSFVSLRDTILFSDSEYDYEQDKFCSDADKRKIEKMESDTKMEYVSDKNIFNEV